LTKQKLSLLGKESACLKKMNNMALPFSNRKGDLKRGTPREQVPFGEVAGVFRAALLLGACGGFVLACILTVTSMLGVPLGNWWMALAQAHGDLQLFGWAGLFVVGVSLHFLPRLRGAPLVATRPIGWLIAFQVCALTLRVPAQSLLALTGSPVWRVALIGSGVLQFLALGGFVLLLVLTFVHGPALDKRPAFLATLPFIACAYLCLALAALVNLVNLLLTTDLVAPVGDALFINLGLFGFLLPMALGMSARSLPMYAGLESFPPRQLFSLAFLYIAGLFLFCISVPGGWPRVASLGELLLGGGLICFVLLFLRAMRSRGKLPAKIQRLAPAPEKAAQAYQARVVQERGSYGPFVVLVASSYLWLLLGGLLLLLNGVSGLVGLNTPVADDAIRHTLTIGFISLLICGIAPRMLPGFSGGAIASAKLVHATLWLGNLAALLRVGSVLFGPWLVWGAFDVGEIAFGLSGILGLGLAICLAWNIWPALHAPEQRAVS
jgi:hypothetical protein